MSRLNQNNRNFWNCQLDALFLTKQYNDKYTCTVLGEKLKINSIYFISIKELSTSRSDIYYNYLKNNYKNLKFVKIDQMNLIHSFTKLRSLSNRNDHFIVMSPSHYLVPFARFFLGKNVYLDAGWSLFEGSVIARRNFGLLGHNVVKAYVIDFVAATLAKRIFLESFNQKIFYSNLFFIRPNKCEVIYTGVDEKKFRINGNKNYFPDLYGNSQIVLFRGKYTVEAGLDTLAAATIALESKGITFWVLSPGLPRDIKFGKNTVVIRNFIRSQQKLVSAYKSSSLTLGQLSNHSRLKRTIPHKAFESAYMAKPYLTARSNGILEIFNEGMEVLCFNPSDTIDLENKILDFFNDPGKFACIGNNMKKKYDTKLSQAYLSSQLLNAVRQNL
jgi:glycosyltransferase involved in cell wall biosynthesis